MRLSGRAGIIGEASLPGQEAFVLDAAYRLAAAEARALR